MTDRERVIKGLQIERECVIRDCDRDCGKCDLVQERDWLLSVYDDAISMLKEQRYEYEKGFNDAMQDKRELMYEGIDGKWHKKDW